MILHPKGEGQWLIPELCDNDRWDDQKKIDFKSVKAVWLNQYQRINRLTQNIEVVIEKSPPNMVRIEALAAQFLSTSFIANNRNPYASCASRLYRRHDTKELTPEERKAILMGFTRDWINRSTWLQALVLKLGISLVTYEEFCDSPSTLTTALPLPPEVVKTINYNALVSVKDYQPQKITNQNHRQISNLSNDDIDTMNIALQKSQALMSFFGYALIGNT